MSVDNGFILLVSKKNSERFLHIPLSQYEGSKDQYDVKYNKGSQKDIEAYYKKFGMKIEIDAKKKDQASEPKAAKAKK